MSRFSLAGRNAVVTGGSRGIGRAIALGLAEAGADVALTYREKRAEADAVAAEIEKLGRRALPLQMDVTDRSSIEAAARAISSGASATAALRLCSASIPPAILPKKPPMP